MNKPLSIFDVEGIADWLVKVHNLNISLPKELAVLSYWEEFGVMVCLDDEGKTMLQDLDLSWLKEGTDYSVNPTILNQLEYKLAYIFQETLEDQWVVLYHRTLGKVKSWRSYVDKH